MVRDAVSVYCHRATEGVAQAWFVLTSIEADIEMLGQLSEAAKVSKLEQSRRSTEGLTAQWRGISERRYRPRHVCLDQ